MTGAAADAPRPLLQACSERRASLPSSVAAIARCDDGYVVAAEMVAEHFGLTADAFWREMKRGIVYGVVERGKAKTPDERG